MFQQDGLLGRVSKLSSKQNVYILRQLYICQLTKVQTSQRFLRIKSLVNWLSIQTATYNSIQTQIRTQFLYFQVLDLKGILVYLTRATYSLRKSIFERMHYSFILGFTFAEFSGACVSRLDFSDGTPKPTQSGNVSD